MVKKGDLKKYSIEFLIVFLGILSSFAIDNYLKSAQKVTQKNILLDELYLSINEDINQLKIVNNALDDCLNSIEIIFGQSEEENLNDSILAFHISRWREAQVTMVLLLYPAFRWNAWKVEIGAVSRMAVISV